MRLLVPIVHFALFRVVNIINFIEYTLAFSESLYKLLLIKGFENFRWRFGAWRAWYNSTLAYKKVSAYRDYIDKHGGKPKVMLKTNLIPDFSIVPEIDKKHYIKAYKNEELLLHGNIPRKGVMVDESSGSSGTPTSWVRGPRERAMTKQMLQLSYHSTIGKKKSFVINGFALGAWATGMNVSMSLINVSIIKSTGPNIDKIINTLKDFGPEYHYIITGYPPFLKTLADDTRIDWTKYSADAVFGGEGISESLRTYLLKSFNSVLGSYGASDLEINMAAESPFTIALRQLIESDPAVRSALTVEQYGVTPMLFQFNPLAYLFETNSKGELVITLCRTFNLSPRIRYNIHDRGHAIRHKLIKHKLQELGKWDELAKIPHRLDLPVLFLYGRSDMSIDYYGANVTPESINEILFNNKSISDKFTTFKLVSQEDNKHNKRFSIYIELKSNIHPKNVSKELSEELFATLAEKNRDFYNAYYHTATKDNLPEVKLFEFGTGSFKGEDSRIKHQYVATDLKYDKL